MAQNYTRQSSFDDGDTITASLFNNEFNQIVNALAYSASSDSSTGHKHDGTSGQGGNIPKIGDIDFLNKIVVDGTNNRWGFFVQVGSAAVEQIRVQDGAIVPVTDSDIDLGTSSLEFKDLFLDGTAHIDTLDVDANATIAGTLGVTSNTTVGGTLGVTGNTTVGGTLGVTGVLTGTSLDISGNVDIDGVTNLDVVDIDGAVDMASTLTVTGVLTGTSLDISGNVDVDGVTNLDVVDIDGAVNMATTLIVTGNVDFDGDLDVDGTTNLDVVDIDGAVNMATTLAVDGTVNMATTLAVQGNVDFNGDLDVDGTIEFDAISGTGPVTVTNILDEDNMSSDSATALATQQSIKAYVDAQQDTVDTFGEVLALSNTTAGTDISVSTDDKVQFRDAAIYINSSVDGQLDIVADTEIQIAATTVDINGAVALNGAVTGATNITLSGELDAATGDFSGAVDIDGALDVAGTTNLDVVDIDGAVDMATTLAVAGNVDFNGDLDVDGTTNLDVVDIDGAVNMATTLLVTGNVDFNGDLDVDGTTNLDVVDIDGAVDIATTLTVGGNVDFNGDLDVDGTIEFDAISGTGSVTVTDILDQDDMSGNSATALATQQSIKAYVDAQQDTVDTLAEILALSNTSSGTNVELTTTDKVQFRDSAIYINSSADGQLDIVADTEIQIAATTIDIDGAINASGEIIAASLDISGDVDVDGTTNLDVVDIDGAVDMASTLQVDGISTFTGQITANGGMEFVDNKKLTFGTGDDLEIYHDGNNSYINDVGTGNLLIRGASVEITTGAGTKYLEGGSNVLTLFHTGNERLRTSSAGVFVTGTVTATGTSVFASLDISGDIDVDGTTNLDVVDIDGAVDMASTLTVASNIVVGGTVDGRDVATDGTKLDGIEASATADQSNAEIRTAVEAATDSNVFTDADHSKLNAIEASATADQTDAEIRAAVEAATNSNVFTDADHTKLNAIEASADVTDTANVTAAGALMDSELTAIASVKALNQGVATGDSPQFVGITSTANVIVGGNLTVNGTTTTLNTATLDVEDKNITINYGAGDTSGSANGAGITIQDAVDASNNATILWDTTNDEFDFSHPINVTGNITVSGTVDGRDIAADGTKLNTIETSATADQTNAEIRTAVEAASDSNVFTDADHSKLNAIEASATADQTNAEIRTAVEAATNSNVFTDADHSKLNAIEASATADQTNAEIRTAVEAATDSNVFTDADHTKLNAIEASADVTDTTNVVAALTAGTNITIAANGTIASTDTNTTYSVGDGGLTTNDFTNADHSKLNAIEASATADQTNAEIRTAVEAATDSNVFTDADHTKLNAIEASANVTDTANVVAALTAGTNITIASNGTIASTDTNTTYSVGDGGLTQNNFTNADHTKLNGIETSATADQTAAQILAALKTVDVNGTSGVNAGTLDGHALTTASTASTVVERDASGDINARLFRSEYDSTNGSIGFIMTQVDTSSNNYMRPSTPAQLRASLNVENGATADQTAAQIKALLVNGLTATHLAAGSVGASEIGNDVVNSQHYAAGSIDNEHIADNAVNSEHYADGSIDRAHLAADIIDGTKIADDVINSEHYVAGSIDAEHLASDSVTEAKMAANSVDSQAYVNGSIDREHLAADIIDGTKIADDVINSEHYAAGSIDNEHIADNAINSEHYADNSIDALHLNVSGNGTTSQFLRSDADGTFTWATPTDTNTTYSVGDGGLTQNNFTNADHTKLNGIEASATADQTSVSGSSGSCTGNAATATALTSGAKTIGGALTVTGDLIVQNSNDRPKISLKDSTGTARSEMYIGDTAAGDADEDATYINTSGESLQVLGGLGATSNLRIDGQITVNGGANVPGAGQGKYAAQSADGAQILGNGSTNDVAIQNRNGAIALRIPANTQNVVVVGSLSKGSGSFRIDHPLKPETHELVHSFTESPQADLLYSGVSDLVDGAAEINLDEFHSMAEGTFVALNRNIRVFTTNESDWEPIKGSVTGNILSISCQDASCSDKVSWMVIGERQDQHMMDTDWTDEEGRVIVEPLKPEALAPVQRTISVPVMLDGEQVMALETVDVPESIEVIDGVAVLTPETTEEVLKPQFEEIGVVDLEGNPVYE